MNRARLAILAALAGALALLLWTALSPSAPGSDLILAERTPLAPPSAELDSTLAPVASELTQREAAATERSDEPRAKPLRAVDPAASMDDSAALYPLHVHFVLVTGEPAFPSSGHLFLDPIAGTAGSWAADELTREPLSIPLHGARTVIQPIPYGEWRLRVESEPFRHVPETIVAAPTDMNGVKHEASLWAEDEIPVRMQTSDGRAVWSYAEDLGWEEKNLLYQAFEFRSSDQPFPAGVQDGPAPSTGLPEVEFQRPHGHYSQVSLGDDIVGSVKRTKAASRWLGLWVHGRFHSEQFVDPDCTELLYVATLDDLLAQTGQVTLTVIDSETKEPLQSGVKATLKADHAPYRREDQKDRVPSAAGVVTFERVLPGKYDLLVERESNNAQRKVHVVPGVHLDLGVIELGNDPPLIVRVLDEEGQLLHATIEVANYVPGGSTKGLYHPNLFRRTGTDKTYSMSIPDRRCIVRARVTDTRAFLADNEIATANVLVDPAALPPQLDLVARHPQRFELSVETPWEAGHVLEIRDKALDLAIQVIERPRQGVEIQRGTYVTRHLSASGELLGERTIEVEKDTAAISVP